LINPFQISKVLGEIDLADMCLCNQGVAKAKVAIEKAQGPSFGGGLNENIEGMMNTFYRSASIGFAQGT
jgi:hypothetical protein